MPYASQHWLIRNLFHIQGTDETAVIDLRAAGGELTTGLIPDATFANAVRNACQAMLTTLDSARADYSRYDGAQVASVAPDGHYVVEPTVAAATDACEGTFAGMPPQLAVVATLWTGSSLGKGNYGRFYLPYCGYTEAGTPLMSTALTTQFRGAFKTFLDAVNTALPGAASIRVMSNSTQGLQQKPVTQVRVGRVIDTQRRRRSQLDESYLSAALA